LHATRMQKFLYGAEVVNAIQNAVPLRR
jgi:hypothetical protein